MFAVQYWNGAGRGHYSSRTQINTGGKNGATVRVTSWAIIDVRHAALGQIWYPPENHKYRRPEQMYSPSDTGLEMAWGGGHYSRRSRINAGGPTATTIQIISWAIIEIRHGALGQIL